MPRLLGVEIPGDKRIEASLPYIYGIGPKTAKKILEQANVDPNVRAKNLTPEQLGEIVHAINGSGLLIEGDLRREIQGNRRRCRGSVIIAELGISADFQFGVNELRPTHVPEKARAKRLASNETRTLKRAKFKKVLRHGGRTNCTGI